MPKAQRRPFCIRIVAAMFALAASSLLASCIDEANAVDLIATAIPPRIKVGIPGIIEVRMIAEKPIKGATLSASGADLSLTPSTYAIESLGPPRSSASDSLPPNPPALGLVPVRSFRVVAARPGEAKVVVRLSYADYRLERTVVIGVDP